MNGTVNVLKSIYDNTYYLYFDGCSDAFYCDKTEDLELDEAIDIANCIASKTGAKVKVENTKKDLTMIVNCENVFDWAGHNLNDFEVRDNDESDIYYFEGVKVGGYAGDRREYYTENNPEYYKIVRLMNEESKI